MLVFPNGDNDERSYLQYIEEEMIKVYGLKFRTIQKQGYVVKLCKRNDPQEYEHYFCGPHHVSGAICPNCRKPLLRIMAIDMRDPRIGLTECPFRYISLFCCFTCEIAMHEFYYQLLPPDGRISIICYGKGKVEPENIPFFPQRYPCYFPGVPVQLITLTVDQQWYIIEEKKALSEYKKWQEFYRTYAAYNPSAHQIGGIPDLVQEWDHWPMRCPLCNQDMVFLAAFYDENSDPRGFVENDAAQLTFTLCPACYVIGTACLE